MLWVIAAAQILDLITFAGVAAVAPIAAEQNPVTRFWYDSSGIFGVFVFKSLLLIVIIYMVDAMLRRYKRNSPIVVLSVSIPIAWGLAGAASNLAVLYMLRMLYAN